jgi:predicted phosphoribosyltransferase
MQQRARFTDRRTAGRQLADELQTYRGTDALVLALPRGGVPVGFEVAQALDAELDVLVVRKVGAPSEPEFGIGAVAPAGVTVRFERAIESLGLADAAVDSAAAKERDTMERLIQLYRGHDTPPAAEGRTVILVDDGLATGVTAEAAVRAIRKLNPARLVLAVPVCASSSATDVETHVDEYVCLHAPESFGAVGVWYEEFSQTSDEAVIELLEEAHDAVSDDDLREPG